MAVRFDPRRLEVTGAPAPVEEHVRQSGGGAAQFGLSRLGSVVYVPSADVKADNETLVWVDRKGNAEPIAAPPRVYQEPRVSPDGQTLAVTIVGDVKQDIWLYSLSQRALTRLTFGSGNNRFPVWTPDGKRVLFSSSRTRVPQIFWKPVDGAGAEDQISSNQYAARQGAIAPDGKMVLYSEDNPQSGRDIGSVDLSGNHKPRLFLQTPFNETAPAFSPDGRWLAYVSNESGRNEIYVRPFPGPGPKWQLSTDGGAEPVWAHSGKELFYTNGDKLLVAPITTSRSSPQAFAAGPPQVLFEGHYRHTGGPWPSFDVSPDDQRFLKIREETATRINVVLNLFEELRQEQPAN
jgi:serine/threonine-protein kinase